MGQPETAIPELEAYCQTGKGAGSVTALVTLADVYRVIGDPHKSRQAIELAQKADPGSQAAIHARLRWLVWQNRLEELKGISSSYISAREQDLRILLSAASVLTSLNSRELKQEGLKLAEHAAALSPTSGEVQLTLAAAVYQTGDAERAEKLYREFLEKHPNVADALNDLAWVLQEHFHRYDAALELANKGLRLAPDDLNLLDTRGTILMNLPDRLADAKNDFARLVEKLSADTPDLAKAYFNLGRICMQLNDHPAARQHLQNALEIDRKRNVFTPDERSEITRIIEQAGTQARQ